jgi:hypothetical protein
MTKKCPLPEKPVNGLVSSTGLEEGSKAYYVCHKGYVLSGMKERKCVNQSWEGSVPNCLERHCTKLPIKKNGQYVTFPFYKQRCAYLSCDQNFCQVSGSLKMRPGLAAYCSASMEGGKDVLQHVKQKQNWQRSEVPLLRRQEDFNVG